MKKLSKKKLEPKAKGHGVDAHTKEIKRYMGALTEHYQHGQAAIAEQFGGLNTKLDAHAQMIARIMVDVEEIKSELRGKSDRSELDKFEKRLIFLEATVFSGKAK